MENVAYSDPPRVERIEGKTYLMSPRPRGKHHRAAFNIAHIFEGYLKGKTCMAFDDGMPVYLDGENTYIPDAMIVCDRSIIRDAGIYGAPDLVVEVLSPSTMKHDRGTKMRHYAAAGVKEYWLVVPELKTVEVYYNEDGHFEIHETYAIYDDLALQEMTDEERAKAQEGIPVSLYDDFVVSLDDIFLDVDVFQ